MSDTAAVRVAVRRFPYPYRAMLAICSDLDLTANAETYLESLRFLNTTEDTTFGTGVGLEIGNSIYFDMASDQLAYWNADKPARARIRTLIQSGHIDCLHSFGDLAASRAHAGRALDELSRHGCRMKVWVDHAVAPSNFGPDRMAGQGDIVGSPVFHADLTCGFGIEYVWRGRVTSVIGQNVPRTLGGLFDIGRPVGSLRSMAKESLKGTLARTPHAKYAMHGANRLLRSIRLRSGHAAYEFMRANPHAGGVSCGDTADGLSEVLTAAMLQRLVEREAVSILYTHLGKARRPAMPFAAPARAALAGLGERQRRGDILVATTRRVLDYCRMSEDVTVDAMERSGVTWIDVNGPESSAAAVDGLTMYVDDAASARVHVFGRERTDVRRNPPDHTGRASISLPWTRLEFPRG